MIPKLSFIPQALDKWFEKGDNCISVEEIRLKQNIGIFRNTALRFFGAKYRGTGCESPTQKRHCKVYVLSDGRKYAGHSKKIGEGFAERASGNTPRSTKSGYSAPAVCCGFPAETVCSA